jgi:hypothetical protein
MRTGAVVEREGRYKSAANETMERGTPRHFTVVVRAESAVQKTQPAIQPAQTVPKRISNAMLEPTDCAGTETG